MGYPSTAIANNFIERSNKTLTQMQIQKLVYIAHGWKLALYDDVLTSDNPKAWQYGPVYTKLRKALARYGSDPVKCKIRNRDFSISHSSRYENDNEIYDEERDVEANLTQDDEALVAKIYETYGKFHAFQLSALTHQEGTPWDSVYDGGKGIYQPIPPNIIKEHFIGLRDRK